ncbi:MAG: hypothetical protein N2511_04285 [Thermodesulfovibrionales bacterium]|nr:hypothetical protein [Thermodesulfovibrionales bacterium]
MKKRSNFLKTLFVFIFIVLCYLSCSSIYASEKWQGVDESVIERFAKSFGIEPKEPLINTDQGDLLLFLFLVSGGVSGFIAGYYWRVLTEQRDKKSRQRIIS